MRHYSNAWKFLLIFENLKLRLSELYHFAYATASPFQIFQIVQILDEELTYSYFQTMEENSVYSQKRAGILYSLYVIEVLDFVCSEKEVVHSFIEKGCYTLYDYSKRYMPKAVVHNGTMGLYSQKSVLSLTSLAV